MKTLFRILAIGIVSLAGLSSTANAGHWRLGAVVRTYVSGHSSCGCAVYTEHYIRCFDRCGYPVYGHRVLRVNHRCRPVLVAPCPPRPLCVPRVHVGPRHQSCTPYPHHGWMR